MRVTEDKKHAYADPESFVRLGMILTIFFLGYEVIYKVWPSSVCQRNARNVERSFCVPMMAQHSMLVW